ncbi:MAG: heme o synthase [Acidimicrobiales bacterium]|jgi:protoheme IX farnesyltransferase|nr:protoheme IX farnesyltransferase [Acidimicrobiaceae bacterium]MEC7427814.1 heme o synthase [Actinomycetota bacterium]HAE53502.1 protoheme IX farnesyltransferase [Acidimicrobiaceae bacterium]HBU39541.1 protoheme IX farnesyltransferase [Acidimicrobiaceae bacterium]|tara:strand:- start:4337 stop:5254 length:918 start_codon:yes stop_codon:yes gene_type:complete
MEYSTTAIESNGRGTLATVNAFVMLTKPRIIELLLITTVPSMILAHGGMPRLSLVVLTIVGGALAAGGANTFNMYIDRDIDRLMERTQGRPLVTGAITPRSALLFGIALEVVAFVLFYLFVNWLSAVLALGACLFYVFVYSLWLKRTSKQNIVIGGAAGAAPALIGWAAVTGSLGLNPIILFAIVFFWTPPHFWALAIKYADQYEAASVPMLPVVTSIKATATRMVIYTVVIFGLSIWFHVAADMGFVYLSVALIGGLVFLWRTLGLLRKPTSVQAMKVFVYSNVYLGALFIAMAIDVLTYGTTS